jgi:hypothetical protein
MVWHLNSTAVWAEGDPSSKLVTLPATIRYGDGIPGMDTLIPPEVLKPDIRYSVVIGIMGVNSGSKDKIHFSANGIFKLRRDPGGKLHLVETG